MTISAYGGPEVLRMCDDFPEPTVSTRGDESDAGRLIIRVAATGVNRMDILVRNGYPGLKTPLPHICGADIAGTVEETGERVVVYPLLSCGTCSACRAGRPNLCLNWKSIGLHEKGGYAERVAVPRGNVFPLPDEVSFQDAVSLPVTGLTAHHAMKTVGRLKQGETVFIWGAAGMLGSMALQIARDAGARTIAVAGTDERLQALRSLGADVIVDRRSEDVVKRVEQETDGGADIVLDPIGADTLERSQAMLTNGGRLLLCGILGGRTSEINVHLTYYHHRSIHGLFLGTKEDMTEITRLVAEKRVVPLVDSVMPLSEAAQAHRKVEAGLHKGKIVLNI